jgi:Spy/CpxP family protein refolding chaperone
MKRLCALVFVVTLSVASLAWAQPGGGRGGFGGPGGFGGVSLLDLARIEAVQKEIEAVDDQLKGIEKLSEEMRASRAERPQVDWRNMSEADREKAMAEGRARREKEAATANAKLAEILLPLQIERLEQINLQISLQMRGMSALSDPKVAAKLSLTEDQKKKLEAAATANREAMQQAFQGGNRDQNQDREKMREKFQELRKAADEKVLAVLTADQKAAFEKMKGAAFTMPEGAFGRGPRGGDQGGRRGGDQGGRRGGNQ